jgi:hypothetical protein
VVRGTSDRSRPISAATPSQYSQVTRLSYGSGGSQSDLWAASPYHGSVPRLSVFDAQGGRQRAPLSGIEERPGM